MDIYEIPDKPTFIKKLKNKNIKKLFPQINNRRYLLVNKNGIKNIITYEASLEINRIMNKYIDTKQATLIIVNSGIGSFIINTYNNFKYIYGYEPNKLEYDMLFHNCNIYGIENMKLINSDYIKNIYETSDIILINIIN